MTTRTFRPFALLLALVMVVSLACLGPQQVQQTQQPTVTEQPVQTVEVVQQPTQEVAPATQAPAETVAPAAPEGEVTRLQDVKKATIQIEAQGTFADPSIGAKVTEAGRGSGFIIDPSGIAVTNNHVVTGAALLKVWVAGETQPRNAKVLGVSECSDLAVIDIDGDGYSYLKWYDGTIEPGNDIYVAGFPLGDPEYSLTKGIISKAKADGKTSWASVESVIEYDATTNPGNSGGPVITPDGQVLGIHFASLSSARQSFGISRDIAKGVITELSTGKNIDSIGLNGTAVSNDDGSVTGVWVSSVQSGSSADKAGIQGGDIIMRMEDLPLATDGTMSQYCDILRSHDPGATLSVEVVRWATGEILDGQLNGRQLAVTSTLNQGNTNQGTDQGNNQNQGNTPGAGTYNSGDIIFTDEFDQGLDNWVYFLTSGEDSGFTNEAQDGKFRTQINDKNTFVYYRYEPLTFDNTRLDLRMENLGANTNYVGLFCRYSDEGWYEANIFSSGKYELYYYDPNASGNPYKLMYSGASRLINLGKSTNDYTWICNDDQLTLGVNGTEVKTISSKTGNFANLKEGQVGMLVGSQDILPVIVEFDYVTVSAP